LLTGGGAAYSSNGEESGKRIHGKKAGGYGAETLVRDITTAGLTPLRKGGWAGEGGDDLEKKKAARKGDSPLRSRKQRVVCRANDAGRAFNKGGCRARSFTELRRPVGHLMLKREVHAHHTDVDRPSHREKVAESVAHRVGHQEKKKQQGGVGYDAGKKGG